MAFSIQFNFGKPTQEMTEELFYKVIRNKHWKKVISNVRAGKEKAREAVANGDEKLASGFRKDADEAKKRLPGFIFQSTFMETESKIAKTKGAWRKQGATVLNGLCMIDVDHLGDNVPSSQSTSAATAAKTKGNPSTSDASAAKTKGSQSTPAASAAKTKGNPSTSDASAAKTKGNLSTSDASAAKTKGSQSTPAASAASLGARETFEAFRQKVDFGKEGIVMVYVTPSGHGLKIVFKARLEWGNLIDNQHRMAQLLGVEVDEACKDASRLSFICTEEDLLFLDKEIFSYENQAYSERWNQAYRQGHSEATLAVNPAGHPGRSLDYSPADADRAVGGGEKLAGDGGTADGAAEVTKGEAQKKESKARKKKGEARTKKGARAALTTQHTETEPGTETKLETEIDTETETEPEPETETAAGATETYHGVTYHEIIDKWLEGKTPQEGDRHITLLKLATELRYICDKSTERVTRVLMQEPWVAAYMAEDPSAQAAIKDACDYRYSPNLPKHLTAVLAKVLPKEHQVEQEYGGLPFADWGSQIEAMMADYPCLREVCTELEPEQYPAALFASAAFLGTLMTRTWYHFYHRPEEERRLNYSVFIIGDPGSGKSFVGRLYHLIAAPIIRNDEVGNEAINRYKKAMKERGTSTKEQKKDALKQPTPIIRIHGTRTANGVFIEDMCNAVEIVGDKPIHLHMLTFDAELDASTAASKGGQWIDKSAMELKSFHNEEDNQQYKNVDSVTGPFDVFWNFVYTGTPLSLDRKVTERNFGSGLSTRLACIPFPGDNLKMMEWKEQDTKTREADDTLREWAYRLDRVSGELPIRDLVRETWQWTSDRMAIAHINENKADGLLIKRIAYYGIAISIPFIMMRHWEEWQQSHTLTIDDKDLALARLAMNIQYECQRYFFGGYAEHYFENLETTRYNRAAKRKDRTIGYLDQMKNEFKLEDLYQIVDLSQSYARLMVSNWMNRGLVEKKSNRKPVVYRKIV